MLLTAQSRDRSWKAVLAVGLEWFVTASRVGSERRPGSLIRTRAATLWECWCRRTLGDAINFESLAFLWGLRSRKGLSRQTRAGRVMMWVRSSRGPPSLDERVPSDLSPN